MPDGPSSRPSPGPTSGPAVDPSGGAVFDLGGHRLVADPLAALWWPVEATLVVADLHLEKGSAFAARGQLLPPYDTRSTLARLALAIERHRPARVVCLGDSFHDVGAEGRMSDPDRARLALMTAACDWVWVTGNHDPAPPAEVGGKVVDEIVLAGIALRHCADPAEAGAEMSGHYHPKARVDAKSRRIGRACFVEDGRRLILPAFGAYAGGLNVLDPAVRGLLGTSFRVHLLGRDRVYSFSSAGGALVAG